MRQLFSLSTVSGRARCCILGAECLKAVYTALTTGIFLTGFLISAGLDDAQLGFATSLPLISGILYPLSPLLLERFQKRKLLLGGARLCYHSLVICSITVLPTFVHSSKMVLFVTLCLIAGNAINVVVASGFPAWHIGFLPEDIRAKFYAVSGVVNGIFTAIASLIASFLADLSRQSQHQLFWLGAIRMAAFFIALVELVLLLLPKEMPYPPSPYSPRQLFVLPLQNKKFCLTMIPVFGWAMISTMTAYSANAYLLERVQVPYLFISLLQACNVVVTAVTMPFWYKLLMRRSWFGAFQMVFLWFSVYPLLHAMVTQNNYRILLPITLLVYQALMAGGTLYFSNMAYIFTPSESRTVYLSWYLMVVNMGSLGGQALSALLTKHLNNSTLLQRLCLAPAQIILLLQAALALGFGIWFGKVLLKKLCDDTAPTTKGDF